MSQLAIQQLSHNEMVQVSAVLSKSQYFKGANKQPEAPEQIYVKILAGQELGIPPFASVQNVRMINGNPTLGANAMRGLIKRSGKYDYRITESTTETCTMVFFEKVNDKMEQVGSVTYTLAEAQKAGLTSNPSWKKYPDDMLVARCTSKGLRRFCPDLSIATVYTPDELGEVEVVDAEFSPAQPTRAPQVTQEASTLQVDPRAGLITAEQSQDLAALLKPLQFASKDEARLFMAELTECEPVSMLEMAEECAAMAIRKLSQGDATEMLQKWRDDRAFEAEEDALHAEIHLPTIPPEATISTEEVAKLSLDLGEIIPKSANDFVDEWLAANCPDVADIYGLSHAQAMSLLQAAREYSALEGAKAA